MKNLKLYSYSVIKSASIEFKDRVPYYCAILEDEKGARSVRLLEDYKNGKKIVIGQKIIV